MLRGTNHSGFLVDLICEKVLEFIKGENSIAISINSSNNCKGLLLYHVGSKLPEEVLQVIVIDVSILVAINGTES